MLGSKGNAKQLQALLEKKLIKKGKKQGEFFNYFITKSGEKQPSRPPRRPARPRPRRPRPPERAPLDILPIAASRDGPPGRGRHALPAPTSLQAPRDGGQSATAASRSWRIVRLPAKIPAPSRPVTSRPFLSPGGLMAVSDSQGRISRRPRGNAAAGSGRPPGQEQVPWSWMMPPPSRHAIAVSAPGSWPLVMAAAGCSTYVGTTAKSFLSHVRNDPDPNARFLAYSKLGSHGRLRHRGAEARGRRHPDREIRARATSRSPAGR